MDGSGIGFFIHEVAALLPLALVAAYLLMRGYSKARNAKQDKLEEQRKEAERSELQD